MTPRDELGAEHPDGAEIQQVQRAVRPHLVVAHVRVAVQDAVAVQRHIPGAEQRLGDAVALVLRRVLLQAAQQRPAVQPGHGEQPAGAVAVDRLGHVHHRLVGQHEPVQPHLRRLAQVVEFLAQPVGQFLEDLVLADGAVHAVIQPPWRASPAADRPRPCSACRDTAACRRPRRRPSAAPGAPGRARPPPPPPARRRRISTASPAPARPACAGARRPSPSAARSPATAPVRRRIRPAARPARWRGTAPPSSAGPSARRG